MKRRAASICACIAASLPLLAPAAEPLDEVLHGLALHRHGRAQFVEQHFIKLLKRPVESSGELLYDAPDRLEKRTLEPRPETLLLTGDSVTIRRGTRSHVLDLGAYPQLRPFIDSIRATLAGDRPALERSFRVQFAGTPARWTLVLSPSDPELDKTVTSVQIDGIDADLQRIEIREPGGDRSVMTLRTAPP